MQDVSAGHFAGWLDRDPVAYHAGARPDRVACIELLTGERLTYRDLDERVGRTAGWLTRQVSSPLGRRIAYIGRSSINQLAVMFACHRLGAIFQPLNWRLTGAELAQLIEDGTPSLALYDTEFSQAAREALSDSSARGLELTHGGADFAREVAACEPAACASVDPDAPFVILYTSGTTGRPKGAVITRTNAFFGAFNFMSVGQVSAASAMLCDAPMFHTVGLMAVARTAMQAGAAMLIADRLIPERTLSCISDPAMGVTHYFAVPQIAQMLRDHPDYARSDLTRLTGLFTGGAPMPPSLTKAYLDDGVKISNGYGMTEAGTVMHMPLDIDICQRRLEWAGLPAPASRLRIVRADGTDAAPGETGEIWLKGPGVMPGYWNRPDENAKSFVDGWFRSGDAGLRDAEGYVRLVDRWKDMYITGGENVYPAEVEAVLAAVPGVTEVAVVGVADARWGESGWAFVVADPAAGLSAAAVAAGCDGKLARYKLPKEVRFLDALPRTASGKVRKDALRAMAQTSV